VKSVLAQFRLAYVKLEDDLHSEALITMQTIENITEILNELRSLPQGITTSIDGIQAGKLSDSLIIVWSLVMMMVMTTLPLEFRYIPKKVNLSMSKRW
jgi:hypothetical protein